ncbi:MAG: S49 family peptidase [Myxococcales bacterium]|nr:S49 family peptidase [Myxococcales bacterium]
MKRPTPQSRTARTSGRSGRSGRSRLVASGAGALLALVASAGLARAEPFPARGERVFSPGRSAASEDSGEALVLNPANLGFLTGKELRWTGVRCTDTQRVACGHSFDLSTPVMWGLGAGFRVDYISPPSTAGGPYFGQDYVWLTWGLGYSVSRSLSFGATLQTSFSPNRSVGGIVALSAGVSYRPSPRLAFGLVAHDFNGPASFPLQTGASRALLPVLDRQYVAAASFRPTGTRAFEVGAEVRYYDGADQARPRAVLGIDIPGVGRARGDVEVGNLSQSDPAYLATLGLELNLRGASLGGGAIVGNALGRTTDTGQYLTAGLADFGSPASIPRSGHAVTLRLEATPGTRSHVRLLRRLWRLSERSDIEAVTLLLRDEPATSFAHAEELADAFRLLRARGKKVVCSFETAGPKGLFACASADRVVLNPAGGVRYSGLKSTHIYLAGLLDKIGVKAEFVRIGAHKSAPEQLMNRSASDVARADQGGPAPQQRGRVRPQHVALQAHAGGADPRGHAQGAVRRRRGARREARRHARLRRRARPGHAGRRRPQGQRREIRRRGGRAAPLRPAKQGRPAVRRRRHDRRPLEHGAAARHEALRQLHHRRERQAPPRGLERARRGAARRDARRLFARGRRHVARAAAPRAEEAAHRVDGFHRGERWVLRRGGRHEDLRVAAHGDREHRHLLRQGRRERPARQARRERRGAKDHAARRRRVVLPRLHPDERTELERKVGQFYDVFVDRVSQGRKLTREQVDAVGQGRVWAGQQALDKKLVDEMGGLRHALEHARKAANLPEDAPIQEEPPVTKSLLETALELAGYARGPMVIDGLPVQVKDVVRAVAPMAVYADSVPLARMEWETLGENGVDDD